MSIALAMAKAQIEEEKESKVVGAGAGTRVQVLPSKGSSAIIKIGKQTIIDCGGCCIQKKWAEKQTKDM